MMVLAVILASLSGCVTSGNGVTPSLGNPEIPADIQVCIRNAAPSDVPARVLTVNDVEKLWKKDRLQIKVLKQCGTRFITWYEALR